jgi:hypothetical protein
VLGANTIESELRTERQNRVFHVARL